MIALILTLTGIALTVIISVIGFIAMGDGFFDSSNKAKFTQLQNESNQISVAANVYFNKNHRPPESVEVLFSEKYLRTPFQGVYTIGDNEKTGWIFGFDDFVSQSIPSLEECALVNKSAGGSGEVADVPLCQDSFDSLNPCCTIATP